MSTQLREIKQRIRSTRQIRQVTGALKKVAAARLARERAAIADSRRYTRGLVELLRVLLEANPEMEHPLCRPGRSGAVGLVVFGSERGLCGGYNARVMEAIGSFVGRRAGDAVQLLVTGGVVARRARRQGLAVIRQWPQPSLAARAATVDAIAETVTRSFLSGDLRDVVLLYTRFHSALRQEPVTERVVPVLRVPARGGRPPAGARGATPPSVDGRVAGFEPAPAVIFGRIVPEYVRQIVDDALLNSLGSEDAARQTAMSRATENARELLGELRTRYSRLRQDSITTEMIELSGALRAG
jgi:F-type H+-transporting ATPase subunit gamma